MFQTTRPLSVFQRKSFFVEVRAEMMELFKPPVVSTCCITYNHESFIKDAVEGFLMQETSFLFEIVVSDDCSTDNTRALLQEYLQSHPTQIGLILNETNIGVVPNFAKAIKACSGKYIALCEGDDYWTDPLKLQKQVDFMEAHPECSLCCHKVQVKYEGQEEQNYIFPDLVGDQIFSRDEMYQKYISATCSVMFRKEKVDELLRFLEGFRVGDMPLYSFYLQFGRFGYIDQVMATYRKHDNSFWHPNYQEYRFPVLFDTFTKIKSRLRIHDSPALNAQISYYADELLKKHFSEKNFKAMRTVIYKDFSSVKSAKKHRQVRFRRYALISHFPWLFFLYKRTIKRSKIFPLPEK